MVRFENRNRNNRISMQKIIADLLAVNPPIDINGNKIGLKFSISVDDRTKLDSLEIKSSLTIAQENQIISKYPELEKI